MWYSSTCDTIVCLVQDCVRVKGLYGSIFCVVLESVWHKGLSVQLSVLYSSLCCTILCMVQYYVSNTSMCGTLVGVVQIRCGNIVCGVHVSCGTCVLWYMSVCGTMHLNYFGNFILF